MIPELFQRNTSGSMEPIFSTGIPFPNDQWEATELVVGAKVRVTIRNGGLVRLEVRKKPSREQRFNGISNSWFRDVDDTVNASDYWLVVAGEETVFHGIPDGEWVGVAHGPKIADNPYGVAKHRIALSSLVPWRNSLSTSAPLVPAISRCPIDFYELKEWGVGRKSALSEAPLRGVVWWYLDSPVAKVVFDG